MSKAEYFQTDHYQRHNQRRQEHLATLGLPLAGKTVLEVGAGIGDHTSFFVDRKCHVTSTDGRSDLVDLIKARYGSVQAFHWDIENAPPGNILPHQIVYCYGLLYHVPNPEFVLKSLASLASEMLLLETCVSFGEDLSINALPECPDDPTQALSGKGCRPTRRWIFSTLAMLFPYVYLTRDQPWHEEFPLDWTMDQNPESAFARSVFVASRQPIPLDSLSDTLLDIQTRC
jgi:hypothetical protein